MEKRAVSMNCKAAYPLAMLLMLGACDKTSESASTAAATVAASGPLTPDISADRCKLLPPENIADYQRAHDVFTGVAGLTPEFEKGELFAAGDIISFKWDQAAKQSLNLEVSLLRQCSETAIQNTTLYETPAGSGTVSSPMYNSAAGSSYPSGTPGVVRVTMTEVDMQTMKGKTTLLGEYTIRLEGPKD